jgi:hypothetical protein
LYVASFVVVVPATLAADLDATSEGSAKEATRLYKQGQYEEAARLYAQLSVDHPDMPIFERNMGACFYYLKRPEPALSNLRNYLLHKKDITADDKAVVERWIAEMEQLRGQPAPPVQPSDPTPAAAPPALSADVPPLPAAVLHETPAASPALDVSSPQVAVNATNATPRAFYQTWWFWTGAGVVAAGAVTAILLSTRSSNTNVPEAALGNQGAFR